jgi:hypothetical protein
VRRCWSFYAIVMAPSTIAAAVVVPALSSNHGIPRHQRDSVPIISNLLEAAARVRSERRPVTRTTGALALVLVSLVAASAVVLALVGTRHGANLSPDSAWYISGARNLAAGRGYTNYAQRPITAFPPGLSMTLALGDRLGVNPIDGARWLNAFAYAVLVILTFVLARRHVRRSWLAVGAAVTVAVSQPMLGIFTSAWSEPIFCALAVGLLLVLESLIAERGRDPRLILVAGLLVSVGFAYRYAEVPLFAVAALAICVGVWPDGLGAVLRRMFGFLAIASVGPAVIVARNLGYGSAFDARNSSIETPKAVFGGVLYTWRDWVQGLGHVPPVLGDVVLIVTALLVLLGFAVVLRRQGIRGPSVSALLPTALFVVVYVVYLIETELRTLIDKVDSRLLSPIFAPVVVLVVFSLEALLDSDWVSRRRWLVRAAASFLGLWLAVSLGSSATFARENRAAGRGFAASEWMHSDFVLTVRNLPMHARVYSDVAEGLYLALPDKLIYDSPTSPRYRADSPMDELSRFVRQIEQSPGSNYLAWYEPTGKFWLVPPAELRRDGLHLTQVVKAANGVIYRVS